MLFAERQSLHLLHLSVLQDRSWLYTRGTHRASGVHAVGETALLVTKTRHYHRVDEGEARVVVYQTRMPTRLAARRLSENEPKFPA
jgi:hypothetical protein